LHGLGVSWSPLKGILGDNMSNDLFPSGPWIGFYNHRPGDRHRSDLQLTFINGSMTGDGVDDVGRFLIRGPYDPRNKECYWTKSYVGAHDVFYRGFREGKGIWGTWEITNFAHGGFHIWSRQAGEGGQEAWLGAHILQSHKVVAFRK
jgi:hypothetical protein